MEDSEANKDAATSAVKRKSRSKLERRKIVEETLKAGASVIKVAHAHGVRANQVHHWRGLYRQGLLGTPATTVLVPVTITDSPERGAVRKDPAHAFAQSQRPAVSGAIHIETATARVCVDGVADISCVRLVLEYLLG